MSRDSHTQQGYIQLRDNLSQNSKMLTLDIDKQRSKITISKQKFRYSNFTPPPRSLPIDDNLYQTSDNSKYIFLKKSRNHDMDKEVKILVRPQVKSCGHMINRLTSLTDIWGRVGLKNNQDEHCGHWDKKDMQPQ